MPPSPSAAGGPPDLAVVSLLAFWADAGVDVVALDQPFDRIEAGGLRRQAQARPPAESRPAPSRAVAPAGSEAASGDLADFVARAVAAAEAVADLPELAAAVAAFDFGRLGRGAPVFARWSESPTVLVLGDEPCPDDGDSPFSGRAGGLLDRMLAAAGLREAAFVSNVAFFRSGGDRALASQRQAVCRPFLQRAVALAQPRATLVLGGEAAAWAGLGDGILKARGRWAALTEHGTPSLATFHPAFLLDHAEAKKRAWADLMSLTARIADL